MQGAGADAAASGVPGAHPFALDLIPGVPYYEQYYCPFYCHGYDICGEIEISCPESRESSFSLSILWPEQSPRFFY